MYIYIYIYIYYVWTMFLKCMYFNTINISLSEIILLIFKCWRFWVIFGSKTIICVYFFVFDFRRLLSYFFKCYLFIFFARVSFPFSWIQNINHLEDIKIKLKQKKKTIVILLISTHNDQRDCWNNVNKSEIDQIWNGFFLIKKKSLVYMFNCLNLL